MFGDEKITIYVTGEPPADVDFVNSLFMQLACLRFEFALILVIPSFALIGRCYYFSCWFATPSP